MNSRSLINNILFFGYIIIFLFIAITCSNTVDPDFWARLLQGDAFLELNRVLKQDPFSYTQTHIWLDHEWGSGVIFSFILNHFGFIGILLSRLIISFLIYFFIYKTVKLRIDEPDKLLFLLFFVLSAFALPNIVWSGLRCHFFTFLFFTIFIYILEFVRKTGKYKFLVLLPSIMVIWVNCHGGCVAGLGILLIYTICEALKKGRYKYYALALLFCFLVMFINPYGADYVKFIFMASTMSRPYVTEWISAFSHPDITFLLTFKVLYIINLILLLTGLKNIKKEAAQYILLVICAYLSFRYVKNIPFFIIASMIFLYPYKINTKPIYKVISVSILVVCTILVKYFGYNYFLLDSAPYKEVEFIKINDLQGKITAPMDMGSYIAYKLYPKNLIYMDGRYEEVYYNDTKELLDKFYNVESGWEKILENPYTPDYIIIPANALINDYIPERYKAVYKTDNNILYVSENKLKDIWNMPSDDYNYYLKHAFERNFNFVVQ